MNISALTNFGEYLLGYLILPNGRYCFQFDQTKIKKQKRMNPHQSKKPKSILI